MRRRLLTLLTILSLLLCVAVAALWVRGYWRADCFLVWTTRGELSCEGRAGYLSVRSSNLYGDRPGMYWLTSPVGEAARERRAMRGVADGGFLGIFYDRDARPATGVMLFTELQDRGLKVPAGMRRQTVWYVPFWSVALLTAGPTAVLLWRRHALGQRRARGLCPRCGYDLRATPDRCPECGAAGTAPA